MTLATLLTLLAACPDCGAIGMEDCERVRCTWDQFEDGTRVTAQQRADGARLSEAINALIAKRNGGNP